MSDKVKKAWQERVVKQDPDLRQLKKILKSKQKQKSPKHIITKKT